MPSLLKSFKRHWRIVANLTISAGVFSFLLYRFGDAALFRKLARADLPTISLAVLVVAGLSIIHLARWRVALKQLSADIGSVNGLRLLFVGYFFNQTLPSSVGGDVFRIWLTNRTGVALRSAVASVLADRIAALLGLFALCIVLAPFISGILGMPAALQIVAACLLLLAAAGLFIVWGNRLLRLFASFAPLRHLADLVGSLRLVFGKIAPAAKMIALSALIHFIGGFSVFLIAKSIGITIAAMTCISLFPFIILATVLPISFAGWGVREGAAILAFGLVGVSPEDALSISVLLGVVLAINGIPGGILWLFKMHSAVPDQIEQQARH
jgi:uncharacterized membrane protein YbhN (UPF0104 family)